MAESAPEELRNRIDECVDEDCVDQSNSVSEPVVKINCVDQSTSVSDSVKMRLKLKSSRLLRLTRLTTSGIEECVEESVSESILSQDSRGKTYFSNNHEFRESFGLVFHSCCMPRQTKVVLRESARSVPRRGAYRTELRGGSVLSRF